MLGPKGLSNLLAEEFTYELGRRVVYYRVLLRYHHTRNHYKSLRLAENGIRSITNNIFSHNNHKGLRMNTQRIIFVFLAIAIVTSPTCEAMNDATNNSSNVTLTKFEPVHSSNSSSQDNSTEHCQILGRRTGSRDLNGSTEPRLTLRDSSKSRDSSKPAPTITVTTPNNSPGRKPRSGSVSRHNSDADMLGRSSSKRVLILLDRDGIPVRTIGLKEKDEQVDKKHLFDLLKKYKTQVLILFNIKEIDTLDDLCERQFETELATLGCSLQFASEEKTCDFCKIMKNHSEKRIIIYVVDGEKIAYASMACDGVDKILNIYYKNPSYVINGLPLHQILRKIEGSFYEEEPLGLIRRILEDVYERVIPDGYSIEDYLTSEQKKLVYACCRQRIIELGIKAQLESKFGAMNLK